jgi:hypothetical protein
MAATAMLTQLEQNFPPTNPTPSSTMESIMYQAGQRSVVEWIKQYMEKE